MFRSTLLVTLVSLILSSHVWVSAQDNFESDPRYREALRQLANDLKRELDVDANLLSDEKLLRMMRESNVNSCVMKLWKKSLSNATSQNERYSFAVKQTRDLSLRIELIDNYLKDYGGNATRRLTLAKKIARDADSTTDIMVEVLPAFDKYLGNGKGNFSDGLTVVEQFYDNAFESICSKMRRDSSSSVPSPTPMANPGQYGNTILQTGSGQRYQAAKQPIPIPTPVRVPSPQEAQMTIPDLIRNAQIKLERGQTVIARVVQSTNHLCQYAQMIKKCHEFTVYQDHYGRAKLYHGNLYADCEGYIMVEHLKQ